VSEDKKSGVYVTGSGPIWVPAERLNEIPKVVAEQHRLDAQRDRLVTRQATRIV
jgi:hypothetical protein